MALNLSSTRRGHFAAGLAICVLGLAVGCGPQTPLPLEVDAGQLDAGSPDAGAADAGPLDGGTRDGGADAGPPDCDGPDAGTTDACPPDGGTPDGGLDAGAPWETVEPGEANAAGTETSFLFDARAFEQPLAHLTGAERTTFYVGQSLFQIDWVAPPSSSDRVGLGPTFNAASCQACHLHGGRGALPDAPGGTLLSALLRLSMPGTSETGGPLPSPVYGDQLNPHAAGGAQSEGSVTVRYTELSGTYADGTPYTLQQPVVDLTLALGDGGEGLLQSLRVAPSIAGLGLLEAIPDEALLANADPDDLDGDGISGRANQVWDVTRGQTVLGRFGWKANQPSLEQQDAAAFLGDMGITTPLFPDDNCPAPQTGCLNAPKGPAPEVSTFRLETLDTYVRDTTAPGRRDEGAPEVLQGKRLFHTLGCARCHVPRFTTGEVPDAPLRSNQVIWPYTDLLLHDLGPGLADGRPDFLATGSEWRTPPLWGLGLQDAVSGRTRLLHDGRARDPAEAILWHEGEAAASAEAFRALPASDRAALMAFLRSL